MRPDSQIKEPDRGGWHSFLSLAFVQSDHENVYLVNTVYLTLQKSSAKLKRLVEQRVATKPPCDLPDADLKGCERIKPAAARARQRPSFFSAAAKVAAKE